VDQTQCIIVMMVSPRNSNPLGYHLAILKLDFVPDPRPIELAIQRLCHVSAGTNEAQVSEFDDIP
jgi:hypothetical protein